MRNPIIKTSILFFVALCLTFSACNKEDNVIVADATITDTGSVAADGCGWLITIGTSNTTYKADNLPAEYEVNNLKVHVKYKLLDTRYYCGMMPVPQNPGIANIHITSITK